ncbi:MAG TPA: site-specific integrase [Pyrinomonadaceae bacterium]|nr:site-specific integrase [Pyrinomonadaceae bacterium]
MAIYKRHKGRRLKRSDRDWDKGTWWIEFSLRGNYVHESIPGARTQAQAERAENKRREEIYEGKYNPVKKLFSEFVDETFLPWSTANKRSHREDDQRSVTLKAFFGEKHLRDIKPMMIEKFKRERLATPTKHDTEERPRPRTPASVNRDLACLSKILSMAFDNELIDSNPMRRVRLLKENGSRERFITADEEVKLFAKLTGRRDHIRSVVTVALNTGMRRGEILDLQWEHVNFIARTIFIARSKTGKTRTIPMNDIVFDELKALKQDAGTRDFVFSVSKTGVNIDSIKTGWRNACAAAGLVDLRFHDTRHTFATRLRANGVHEWDIRDLLGHTTTRMTSVYTHQTPANLRQAVTTLGQSKPGRVVRFPRKNRDSQRERKAG